MDDIHEVANTPVCPQKHALTVMEGLGAAVETLQDSQLLNAVLIALGQTHDKRNIKPWMLTVSVTQVTVSDR